MMISYPQFCTLVTLVFQACRTAQIARAKSTFRTFAYSTHAVHEKEKIMHNSGLREAPASGIFHFG